MKHALLALCLLSPAALACEKPHLSLSGNAVVATCFPQQEGADCVFSGQAVYEYMEAVPDTDEVITIGLSSSPWRMYDADMRIITVDEVADAIKSLRNPKVERAELIGSWTGVSPKPGVPSLADQVSKALDGFPVKGEDGFLWLSKEGKRRTTRQAFTMREGGGSYYLPKGAEVLVPLAAGWPAEVQGMIPKDDALMLTRAAAGWDVFYLCPDNALAGFEHAAKQGSAVGAYNAALMRLERGAEGDRDAAVALLERAAALGDEKSRARLGVERANK